MLNLSRKKNETIVINGNIRVTICGFKSGNRVILGIEAPPEVNIVREELIAPVHGDLVTQSEEIHNNRKAT